MWKFIYIFFFKICSNQTFERMSGRLDSNQRPLAPHASALPGCATSRKDGKGMEKCGYIGSFINNLHL